MNEKRNFFWQSVTGSVEDDEDYIHAALREAQEETGLSAQNVEKIILSSFEFNFKDSWSDKEVTEKVYFIKCKHKWDVVIDPNEHSEFRWVEESKIHRDSVHFESNFKALTLAKEVPC